MPLGSAEQDALIIDNQALASWWVDRQYKSLSAGDREQLIEEAKFAIVRAARTYEPGAETKFSSWAVWKIRGALSEYHRRNPRQFTNLGAILNAVRAPEPDEGPGFDLAELCQCLPERYREVIRMRFAEGLTLQEVGDAIGVTKERVRQMQKRALARLRTELEAA